MLGIIQEQHPRRASLFLQWKGIDWPVLIDSLNLLEVSVVPITLLIDEHGVIRRVAPRRSDPAELVEAFLAESFEPPQSTAADTGPPDLAMLKPKSAGAGAAAWRRYGEALTLWGGEARLNEAIAALDEAIALDPEDGWAEFRRGVASRLRYDSPQGRPADFKAAVSHWTRARQIDPNNYIWLRRIQQFGPRLDKPYPFYDWVAEAREAIESRGETPPTLAVEPRGAELTSPSRSFRGADAAPAEPDPEGRIHRDAGRLIRVDGATVPLTVGPGKAARVHLEFRPNPEHDAHWNNEAAGMVVWVDPPAGWLVDRRKIELANPASAASLEKRRVELEVRRSERAAGPGALEGYALYYVCEGAGGPCLYRRQDISVTLGVEGPDGS